MKRLLATLMMLMLVVPVVGGQDEALPVCEVAVPEIDGDAGAIHFAFWGMVIIGPAINSRKRKTRV